MKNWWFICIKKVCKYLLYTILLCFLIIGVSYLDVERIGNKHIYNSLEEVPQSYVGIVLGARVYSNGSVSPILADRLMTGIELYKEGKVKKLLLSGDHGQVSYDEVNAMREFVSAHGVPDEDIFMDHAGFSTYDSMYRARDIFTVNDAIIVTQDFHLPRALYIGRQLSLNVVGFSADKRQYIGMKYLNNREILARAKAVMQIVIHDKPKYLGKTIPITGDGRETNDKI